MSAPLSHEDATEFFAVVFLGKHHIPGKSYGGVENVKPYGEGWCVVTPYDLATYDGDTLTRLVLHAHDAGFRVEITPAMRYLRIAVWRRPLRTGGSGWDRHPTIETALAAWRVGHPAPKDAP